MKKGAIHIEIILATVIFVTFIISGLYFFSPSQSNRLTESTLNYLISEIEKNTSVELESYSIKINPGVVPPEQNVIAVKIKGIEPKMNVLCENEEGEIKESKRNCNNDQDITCFKYDGESRIILYYSEDIVPNESPLDVNHLENIYKISLFKKGKFMSEKRLELLTNVYNSDYDELKKEFNLPSRIEFGFKIEFDDGREISATKEIPRDIEIFVKEKRIEILNKTGSVEFATFIGKVW